MIIEIQGDIRDTDCKLIAHGVNCQGVMGSGVAKALYEKWPKVKSFYLDYFTEFNAGIDGENFLGEIDVIVVDKKTGQQVANCFTQQYYGPGNKRYLSYDALYKCLQKIYSHCNIYNIDSIAVPKIGCGLAGGNWNIVREMILDIFPNDITVKVYSL